MKLITTLITLSLILTGCSLGPQSIRINYVSPPAVPDLSQTLQSEYDDYIQTIRGKVSQSAHVNAVSSGEGNVALVFELSAIGKLKSVGVVKEKTTAPLPVIKDAVWAVKKAAPFPPFPQDLRREYKELTFNVVLAYETK